MQRIAASTFRAATRVLGWLSIGGQRRLGRLLGWWLWRSGSDVARITDINLALCFPELPPPQRRRMARESLQHTAQLAMEAGAMFHWPPDRWPALTVSVVGEALIAAAQAEGRGVLILVPHLGNWEYLSLFLGKYRVTALYDPPRMPALEEPIKAARSRAGANLLPIDRRGLRAVYQALSDGGVVALLPDQVPARSAGVYADFFGVPALTMTFAHRLIIRAHPVVLFGTAIRVAGGFALRFVEPEDDIYAADPERSASAMNGAIERLVHEFPAQYQWEYKRFKRQAAGEPDCYARRP